MPTFSESTLNKVKSIRGSFEPSEKRLKEKKSYSAFYTRVPPKVSVPLKRGDSVSDVISKLYTLLDKSFERKKKEQKAERKLEKERQKKRDDTNKRLLKSLSGSGGVGGMTPKVPGGFPLLALGALALPKIEDLLKGLDFDGIKEKLDNILKDKPTQIDEYLRGKSGELTQSELPFWLRKIGKGLGKITDKIGGAFKPKVKPKTKPPKSVSETPKAKPTSKVPGRKGSIKEKSQQFKAKRAPVAPPPAPTAVPAPAPEPIKAPATKFNMVAENSKKIAGFLREGASVFGKVAPWLLKKLPFIEAAAQIDQLLMEYGKDQDETKLKKGISGAIGELLGGIAGTDLAAPVGAMIGTAILPGIGTLLGGVLAGVGGAVGGASAGKWVGEKIYENSDFLNKNFNVPKFEIDKKTLDAISSYATKIGEFTGITEPAANINEAERKVGEEIYNKVASDTVTQGLRSIIQATTEKATIIANSVNIGDMINSAQKTQEELNMDASSSASIVNTNTIGMKGSSSSQDYGELLSGNGYFEDYYKNWKQSIVNP